MESNCGIRSHKSGLYGLVGSQWLYNLPMRNLEDFKPDLQGFINHSDQLSKEDSTSEYRRQYEPLSYYWRQVKAALDLPFEYDKTLKDGFWPTT